MQRCVDEPVQRPGLIQPYGALLVCDPQLVITYASENIGTWVGLEAKACIHRKLVDLLDEESIAAIDTLLSQAREGTQGLVPNGLILRAPQHAVDLTVSREGEHCFIEIEAASGHEGLEKERSPASVAAFFARLQQSAQRMVASTSCEHLCEILCQEVRRLFGHDRVLAYRFDRHWHGQVIAESRNDVFPSYLGHKFPESDIPAQARQLFLDTMLRMIPDAQASMISVVGPAPAQVNMTHCHLRAPAQVHLEYMANMGTRASMTLSLRTESTLWGLIACHHATPRYLTARLRNAAELLVRLASSLLSQRQYKDGDVLRERLTRVHGELHQQMLAGNDVLPALCDQTVTINDMNHTRDGSCAIRIDGHWRTLGSTPPQLACERISAWLDQRDSQEEIVATDHLAGDVDDWQAHVKEASGLIAMTLPQGAGDCVLWFLPELTRETTWAGNPNDHVHHTDHPQGRRLHPRASFEMYHQTVREHSRAIVREEIAAIKLLRKTITEVELAHKVDSERRLRNVAEQERLRAEQATRVREHVLNIVSHDLRNPLGTIELSGQLARRRLERRQALPPLVEYQSMLDKIDIACLRMRRMVEDVLSLSKMQGGQWQVERSALDGQSILRETHTLLESVAEAQHLNLTIEAPEKQVACVGDAERLMQALGNLVGNAFKFTPEGGTITLSVQPSETDDAAVFCVRDTGRGIAKEDQAHIFEAFWQAAGRENTKGLGLGLSIVKQIVDAHGGALWVKSEPGQGTGIWFTCPNRPEDRVADVGGARP